MPLDAVRGTNFSLSPVRPEELIAPENLVSGRLSNEQLTGRAGYVVVTARLSDLPHWGLVRSHIKGSDEVQKAQDLIKQFPREMRERIRAAADLMAQAGMGPKTEGTAADKDELEGKNFEGARELAAQHYANVRSLAEYVHAPQSIFAHMQDVQEQGVDAVIDRRTMRHWESPLKLVLPYTFPGLLSEPIPTLDIDLDDGVIIPKIWKKCAAVMLLNGDQCEFEKVWAAEIGLPQERIKRYPDQRIHHLIAVEHEAQHLLEVNFESTHDEYLYAHDWQYRYNEEFKTHGLFNDWIRKFYEEVHGDMGPHSRLRRLPFGDQEAIHDALTMDRHKRYMGLLFNNPHYWFAPTLDALERRQAPPTFYQIHQSVMEIRLRLVIEAEKLQRAWQGLTLQTDFIASQELNDAVAGWRRYPGASAYLPGNPKTIMGIPLASNRMVNFRTVGGEFFPGLDNLYMRWCDHQFFSRPEIFHTILKMSREDGAFRGNPLTQKIAGKIIEAAEYFDPTLTCEPKDRLSEKIAILPRNGIARIAQHEYMPA